MKFAFIEAEKASFPVAADVPSAAGLSKRVLRLAKASPEPACSAGRATGGADSSCAQRDQ